MNTDTAEVFASSLHARWIGTLAEGWLWHLGNTAERTLCGRNFRGGAQPINRDDVYDQDWLCHACMRSDKAGRGCRSEQSSD